MYSPEQPFWARVASSRRLTASTSDRTVSSALFEGWLTHACTGSVCVQVPFCLGTSDMSLGLLLLLNHVQRAGIAQRAC